MEGNYTDDIADGVMNFELGFCEGVFEFTAQNGIPQLSDKVELIDGEYWFTSSAGDRAGKDSSVVWDVFVK